MNRSVDIARWAALAAVCLLASGATNQTADALYRELTVSNVQRLLADEEVERFTGGRRVQHAILDLQAAAWFTGDVDLTKVDEWLGLQFAEEFDEDANATSNSVTVSAIDLVGRSDADARFDEIRDELFLVESEQAIGDRFAGLAPQITGLHTVVLFTAGDKVVLMTTSTMEESPEPLVSSEGLVDLARIVAPRLTR